MGRIRSIDVCTCLGPQPTDPYSLFPSMAKRNLQNGRAIVTGASSGIGRALVLELARGGAKLVATARREDRLRQLAEEIGGDGPRVEIVAGDITDPAVRRQVVATADGSFGGLDVLDDVFRCLRAPEEGCPDAIALGRLLAETVLD